MPEGCVDDKYVPYKNITANSPQPALGVIPISKFLVQIPRGVQIKMNESITGMCLVKSRGELDRGGGGLGVSGGRKQAVQSAIDLC